MIKKIKTEIEEYFNKQGLNEKIKSTKIEEKILEIIPLKIKKGIKEIKILNETLKIITKTPSWRQETLFFKKEIMKKIDKKLPNYSIKKIIIL